MRLESDLLKRLSLLCLFVSISFVSVFAQNQYESADYAEQKLRTIHRALNNTVHTEADLNMLRAQINAHKAVVAPHFPVRVDDPVLTNDQAREQDVQNMENFLQNYPSEVFDYVQYVQVVIDGYKKSHADHQHVSPKK